MIKILILQGGFNEEHKVSLNTSREIAKAFKKLKIKFKTLTVNPITFENEILKYSNDHNCFNALHGTFGEDGKIQKILKKNNKSLLDLIISKPLLEPLFAGFRMNFPNLTLMFFKYFSLISFIFITSYLGVKILCLLIIFLDLILLKQLDDEL